MNLDDSADALMDDGDVITSTESHGFTQSTLDSSIKAELQAIAPGALNGTASLPAKAGTPSLKGTGLKRDASVLNQFLTQREDEPRPPKFPNLPYATSQTGVVYDVRMRFHVEGQPTEDDMHPEDPRRIYAIWEAFVQAGLAWQPGVSGPSGEYYMGRVDTRIVTKEEVLLVHTERHWDWVQSLSVKPNDVLEAEALRMDSIYLSRSTPYCAALSAGGAIEACRAVMLDKVKNVFAVIRPPGHHAEREDAKGFCFYDNVSIATRVCQREFGEACRKVFILDWDVHHGNAIQQANYDDPNVLYISLHVHKRGNFYPEKSYRDGRKGYGDHLHCGASAGLGKNVNIPWTNHGMGDADYVYAFQQVVMPIATEFDPDLVIIAAGFDAARGDMLGCCDVTPAGYAHMTHMLMSLANGRVAVCLEGGYNLDSIARSACAVGRTLMGEPPDRLESAEPSKSGVDDIKLVLRQQSKFWPSLYPKDVSAQLAGPHQGERMHDVVRKFQATTLWDEFEMSPLFVHREQLSKSFENQVLATPNYAEARPLLLILHDPPEMLASPDPRTGRIELHNTWLTDIVKTYVAWAVKHGFAVVDVNLPRYITNNEDLQEHEEEEATKARIAEAMTLLTYLWENYVEVNEPTHVFLMGTNVGHAAITTFIKANEDRARALITKTIHFVVDVPLQTCRSQTDDELQVWYHATSLVFMASGHHFWDTDHARKIKKRFGRVYRSGEESTSNLLIAEKETVFNMLIAETERWRASRVADADEMDSSTQAPLLSPNRIAPIGNFALSPQKKVAANSPRLDTASCVASPRGRGTRSPRLGSPLKMPPLGGVHASTGQRPSRSPER